MSKALSALRDIYAPLAAAPARLESLGLLAARLLAARVFLLSGLTKWEGLSINPSTFSLFRTEFFGRYNLPDGVVDAFAVGAAVGEIILPILLIAGLFTRAAALGLIAMTLVIQIFVYPDAWWNVHAWWLALLGVVFAIGPGAYSLDRLLGLEGKRAP